MNIRLFRDKYYIKMPKNHWRLNTNDFGYSWQNDRLKHIKTPYLYTINLIKITFETVLRKKYFRPTLKCGSMT